MARSLNSGLFMNGAVCWTAAFMAAVLLSACDPSPDARGIFHDYRYRLSNALDVEPAPLPPLGDYRRYPQPRQLRKNIEPIRINLLEFLELSHCDMQRLIGQRNSALGKVMAASQQLIYELAFLHAARVCLSERQATNNDDEWVSQLQTIIATKESQLAARLWNATFASAEFRQQFSPAGGILSVTEVEAPPNNLESALQTLATLAESLTGEHSFLVDEALGDRLEQRLSVVGAGAWLGRWHLSLMESRRYLAQIDPMLRARLEERPMCYRQKGNPQAEVMYTVFLQRYIGKVQPYLAKLDQQGKRLIDVLERLLSPQREAGVVPQAFEAYWWAVYAADNPKSEWSLWKEAVAAHTRLWQQLLEQCGMRPGQ